MSATAWPEHPPKLTRYQLPGFGLPLNFTPHDKFTSYEYNPTTHETDSTFHSAEGGCGPLYPNALDSNVELRLTTLREFTMMQLMDQLTDQPDWDIKIFDEKIVSKWKAKALSALGIDITESMFTWCIDEIRYKEFKETGVISAYDGDIVKSDVVIPSSLRHALMASVAPLEDLPEEFRDWHPGSDGTVLDLVHPSLFPVAYGRTRVLRNTLVGLGDCVDKCGEDETLGVPRGKELMHYPRLGSPWSDPYSRKFQWLPCEVGFEGDKVKIKSYINNLHPKTHKPLYEVIERIVELAIPL